MSAVFKLHPGDCIATMRTMADASVDSIVTDPPYELGFMGKTWDASGIANSVEMWTEALRVLKPGGHLLAFSGSRTYHRMVVAIEDGGTVLDPFTGSGSTGKACMREGFNFVGCELSPEYLTIAKARIEQEQLRAAIRAYDAMLKAA